MWIIPSCSKIVSGPIIINFLKSVGWLMGFTQGPEVVISWDVERAGDGAKWVFLFSFLEKL